MNVARAAGVMAIVAAAVVFAGISFRSDPLIYAGSLGAAIAGALVLWSTRAARSFAPVVAEAADAPPPAPPKKKEQTATVLLATLRNAETGTERLVEDLQRVLAGIVTDERGKIDRVEPHTIVAVFARGEHTSAAVHAARRMLSNVDALGRRLGHALAIAIAVHLGPRGEEAVSVAARVQEAATDSVPVLVSAPAAETLGNQLERVDTVVADGWSLDVFTFPPAQKRLPGF